jgi:hypothetical protein
MIEDPDQRITRPRQVYVGALQRPYLQMSERGSNGARGEMPSGPAMPNEASIVGG